MTGTFFCHPEMFEVQCLMWHIPGETFFYYIIDMHAALRTAVFVRTFRAFCFNDMAIYFFWTAAYENKLYHFC